MVRTRSLSAEMMVGDFKQCDVLISCGEDGGGEEVGGIVGQGKGSGVGQGKGSGGAEEEIMNQKSEKGTFEHAEVLLTEVHQTALFFFLTIG